MLSLRPGLHPSVKLLVLSAACVLWIGALGSAQTTPSQELYQGMPRAEVIEVLGAPSSTGSAGSRELLQFGPNIRVELHDGMLFTARGVTVRPRKPSPPAPTPTPSPSPTPTPATDALVEPVVTPDPEPEPKLVLPSSSPHQESEPADEDLYAPLGFFETPDISEPHPAALIAIRMVIQAIYVFIVIQIAFAIVGMPILPSQSLKIVLGYTALATFLAVLPWAAEVRDYFHINGAIRFIGLCTVIYNFSDVSRGLTVLKIALATYIASGILSFVTVMALLLLIGSFL